MISWTYIDYVKLIKGVRKSLCLHLFYSFIKKKEIEDKNLFTFIIQIFALVTVCKLLKALKETYTNFKYKKSGHKLLKGLLWPSTC